MGNVELFGGEATRLQVEMVGGGGGCLTQSAQTRGGEEVLGKDLRIKWSRTKSRSESNRTQGMILAAALLSNKSVFKIVCS